MDKKRLAYGYVLVAIMVLMVIGMTMVKDLHTGIIVIIVSVGAMFLLAGLYKKITIKKLIIIYQMRVNLMIKGMD